MERVAHASLVPRWVVRAAIDCQIPDRAIASHRFERVLMYFALFFLALVPSAMVWLLVLAYFQTPTYAAVVSAWWIVALPTTVAMAYGIIRFSAFRWLRSNWRKATGEKSLEGYLYPTLRSSSECRETLRKVALRVHAGEVPPEQFHLARDIAALHWLCDGTLRIRDLVRS